MCPAPLRRRIAERQEAAQTAVDALPGPHAGVVWRCLEPLRLASRAAASAYGLLAGLLDRSESASVGDGDTLWEHAARSGLSIRELQRGNRLRRGRPRPQRDPGGAAPCALRRRAGVPPRRRRSDVIRSGQRLRYSGEQGFLQAVLFPAPALRRAWCGTPFLPPWEQRPAHGRRRRPPPRLRRPERLPVPTPARLLLSPRPAGPGCSSPCGCPRPSATRWRTSRAPSVPATGRSIAGWTSRPRRGCPRCWPVTPAHSSAP